MQGNRKFSTSIVNMIAACTFLVEYNEMKWILEYDIVPNYGLLFSEISFKFSIFFIVVLTSSSTEARKFWLTRKVAPRLIAGLRH